MNRLRFVFGTSASAMLLAACVGNSGSFYPNTLVPVAQGDRRAGVRAAESNEAALPGQRLKQHRAGGLLFVADYTASKVIIYAAGVKNPAPIATISDGVFNPYSIAFDKFGTLYVQNGNNTITEYRKGRKTVSKTLKESGLTSTVVTVGRDGTVYSSNYDQVFEFAGGSTTPTMTLSVPYVVGLATDRKSNLFASWNHGIMYDAGVYKFKQGSDSPTPRLSGIYAESLAVDSNDDLLVGAGDIYIFRPGSQKFFRKIRIGHIPCQQFAVDGDEKYLYVVLNAIEPKVYVYDYATGTFLWTVRKGLFAQLSAVAIDPAAPQ